jgi:hypothetical protein
MYKDVGMNFMSEWHVYLQCSLWPKIIFLYKLWSELTVNFLASSLTKASLQSLFLRRLFREIKYCLHFRNVGFLPSASEQSKDA